MISRSEIDSLLQERPIPVGKIVALLAKAARLAEPTNFDLVNEVAHMNDTFDQPLAYPAMALLPAWGVRGIDALIRMVSDRPHRANALGILGTIAMGHIPSGDDMSFLPENWNTLPKYDLPADLVQKVRYRLRAFMLEQLTDTYKKSRFLNLLSNAMYFSEKDGVAKRLNFLFDMLIDTHMVINQNILQQFSLLLDNCPDREEVLHRFLVDHPVLLDPFVGVLYTKHELGDDFITDFIIRRINNEYIVVEIERSTHKLFTKKGILTASLNTAIGQVRDFQAWLSDNIAYAQTKLPKIQRPDGLVIIGRRKDLAPEMERRLDEENFSRRGHIRIVTYDDLLEQAKTVYRNMAERPLVMKSKEQKRL